MIERNAGLPPEKRIEFRVGIHLGDVVEESDGDLMGDGVNIAARLEGIAEPGAICLSEDAYRQVKGRLDIAVTDLGPTQLKNIAEPIRVYSLASRRPRAGEACAEAKAAEPKRRSMLAPLVARARGVILLVAAGIWYFLAANRLRRHVVVEPRRPRPRIFPSWCCPSPTSPAIRPGLFRRRRHRKPHHGTVAHPRQLRHRAQHRLHLQGQEHRRQGDRQGARRSLRARRLSAARPEPCARQRAAHRLRNRRASLGRPFRGRRGRPLQAARSSGGAIGECVGLSNWSRRKRKGAPVPRTRTSTDLAMRGWALLWRASSSRCPQKQR